jgi:hypothetical protein
MRAPGFAYNGTLTTRSSIALQLMCATLRSGRRIDADDVDDFFNFADALIKESVEERAEKEAAWAAKGRALMDECNKP